MLIDFHTHCFPDAIAEKAVKKLAGIGGIPYYTNATVGGNLNMMKKCGIDRAVICSIATNLKQQTNVNNFAISLNSDYKEFYALGSIHPDCPSDEAEAELKRLKAAGIRGIKVHPDYMGVCIDDDRFMRIFEKCAQLGLFVVTHAGFDFYSPDKIHASPEQIAHVLDAFPNLRLSAAHFGGNRLNREVYETLVGRDVYIDLSLLAIEPHDDEFIRRILTEHRRDRLLFASDLPWCDPGEELKAIEACGLDGELMENIKYKNALNLLEDK
nr:amidohydrolase family protein [Clostridia bacterium]